MFIQIDLNVIDGFTNKPYFLDIRTNLDTWEQMQNFFPETCLSCVEILAFNSLDSAMQLLLKKWVHPIPKFTMTVDSSN